MTGLRQFHTMGIVGLFQDCWQGRGRDGMGWDGMGWGLLLNAPHHACDLTALCCCPGAAVTELWGSSRAPSTSTVLTVTEPGSGGVLEKAHNGV